MAGSYYSTGPADTKTRMQAAARPSGTDAPTAVDPFARAAAGSAHERIDDLAARTTALENPVATALNAEDADDGNDSDS